VSTELPEPVPRNWSLRQVWALSYLSLSQRNWSLRVVWALSYLSLSQGTGTRRAVWALSYLSLSKGTGTRRVLGPLSYLSLSRQEKKMMLLGPFLSNIAVSLNTCSPEVKHRFSLNNKHNCTISSVADPDPGSGAFWPLDPGSGIRKRFFPDPGSRIPDPKTTF
jgi:hypothetical protein